MTTKQRAYLKGLAMNLDPIFQIGKSSVTPELTAAVAEALEARELIKLSILKNCLDDGREIAAILAERTHSEVVQVIGKKIVLYKQAKEKNKIMEEFAAGNIQVLVSTTVIEVGVNVPNATVMMIENAERFGLAQLHQLRGRVGRGDKQSYCIMVNASGNKEKNRRLEVLNKSNDGFYIASEDLKLRGPGDLFGIRQSGDLEFQLADIYTDAVTLKKVSEDVNRLLERDEDLEEEENQELKKRLDRFMEEKYEKLNL